MIDLLHREVRMKDLINLGKWVFAVAAAVATVRLAIERTRVLLAS
jgi:hypothetical protein